MKKSVIIFSFAAFLLGCADFLNVTPNKTGSSDIYHMDQLYGLMGKWDLYNGGTGSHWPELLFSGDAVDISPYFYTVVKPSETPYNNWSWDPAYRRDFNIIVTTWSRWNGVFTCNIVLEKMDHVIQTTPEIRKQVEGEALYGRAYCHFLFIVQYSLWGDDAPGMGYRVNTDPGEIPPRNTVKYTMDNIIADLDNAEKCLTEAGRTKFELHRNFRPTVPTVQALKARVHLYRGNYSLALENANAALAAYDYLLVIKDEPLYEPTLYNIFVLDQTNRRVVDTLKYRVMAKMNDLGSSEAISSYPEFYHPGNTNYYYGNRMIPLSEYYYNLFDHENDERWKLFYNNYYSVYNSAIAKTILLEGNTTTTAKCFTWEDQQGIKEWHRHAYGRFGATTARHSIVGTTTAEMYLIKAECLARAGNTTEAANVLRALRRTRFTTQAAADNYGGSIQEVLDERAREMTEIWRFYDIKRLNGAENANIILKRTIMTDRTDVNSAIDIEILPNDPRWALSIPLDQCILMGWERNEWEAPQ